MECLSAHSAHMDRKEGVPPWKDAYHIGSALFIHLNTVYDCFNDLGIANVISSTARSFFAYLQMEG